MKVLKVMSRKGKQLLFFDTYTEAFERSEALGRLHNWVYFIDCLSKYGTYIVYRADEGEKVYPVTVTVEVDGATTAHVISH